MIIKYIPKKDYSDNEHYDLIRFLKPIDISRIDEIQQIYHYANDTLVYPIVEIDDNLVLRKMTDIICKTITDDRYHKIDKELGINNNVKKFERGTDKFSDESYSSTCKNIQTENKVLQEEKQEVFRNEISTSEKTSGTGKEGTEILGTERKRFVIDL
jgi:hypothetical protein